MIKACNAASILAGTLLVTPISNVFSASSASIKIYDDNPYYYAIKALQDGTQAQAGTKVGSCVLKSGTKCFGDTFPKGANLQGAFLSHSNLGLVTARYVNFQLGDLSYAHAHKIDFAHALLSMTSMNKTRAKGANFNFANMVSMSLSKANFRAAIFKHANISHSALINANLRHANFQYALARSTSFINANITDADFSYADLTGASFVNAIGFKDANFSHATFCKTIMPNGYIRNDHCKSPLKPLGTPVYVSTKNPFYEVVKPGTPVASGVKINGCTLASLTQCDNADLSGQNLYDVTLAAAKLSGVNFTGAQMRLCGLAYVQADSSTTFESANLAGCALIKGKFRGVNFDKAIFNFASLSYGDFESASFVGANLSFSAMDGAKFHNADFSHANLADTNINNADFTGANFEYANLINADFTGSKLPNNIKSVKGVQFCNTILGDGKVYKPHKGVCKNQLPTNTTSKSTSQKK